MFINKQKKMETCIDYFDKWRQWIKDQKHNLDDYDYEMDSTMNFQHNFAQPKNILSCFLNYAKDLLEQHSTLKHVPYLHNNSSALKSQHYYFRATKTDTLTMLGKGIIASNFKNSNKLIILSSYSSEHSAEDNNNLHNSNFYFIVGSKNREAQLQNLIKKRETNGNNVTSSDKEVGMFLESMKKKKM